MVSYMFIHRNVSSHENYNNELELCMVSPMFSHRNVSLITIMS